jgi:pyruvate dehydrogenase E2 component (dihydrolipoamide acetyltransferase)
MFEFKLPDLGEGVHEGQVVNVLVKEGEEIAEYQAMLEIETDKAAVEIPSPKAGVVAKVHVAVGQTVKVGQTLISIHDGLPGGTERRSEAAPQVVAAQAEFEAPKVPAPVPATARAPAGVLQDGPIPAAPVVRKLARELGVELSRVPATGPGGRVLREDVERFAAGERPPPPPPVGLAPSAGVSFASGGGELPDFAQYGPVRREMASQIRKTIARQMTRAWLNVPRVTHCDKADVTDLERNRKAVNTGLKEGQPKLTLTAIVVKAVAVALRDFPMLNASYDAASEEIIYKDYRHIGIAVDTPRGLVVPVLRDADGKTLPQIAAELADLGARARTVKFEVAELRGATFTITNVGAVGGIFATPMVNYPEVGILGLGRAALEPAVRDGQIVARLLLPLSLSYDHRIVDGADGARFVSEVIRSLENPLRLISLG